MNKKELNTLVEESLKAYKAMPLDDPNKEKALRLLKQEAELERQEEELTKKLKDGEERIALEKEKFEEEKFRSNKELEIKATSLKLETEKFEFEKEQAKIKNSQSDKQFILSILSVAVPAGLTLLSKGIYAGLAINAQRHDYADYKLESKASSEMRQNLNK